MSQNVPNPLEPSTEAAVPAPTPRPANAKPGISNRVLNLVLGGALVLAVAGIAFAAGRMTAPTRTITGANFPGAGQGGTGNGNGGFQGRPGNGNGGFGAFGGGGGGLTVEGTVESISGTTLTLKTAGGQTIQIALDGSTTYHAQTDATTSDVVTGGKVLVRLNFQRGAGGGDGPAASGGPGSIVGSATASDVTVVP